MKKFENLPKNLQTEEVKEYYDILSKKKPTLFLKRLFDTLSALVLFIILLPFNIIIAVAVKTTSKGPVFFLQKRVGKYGKEFSVLKFRTMVVDAEKLGGQITVGKRDPRVTAVGEFLRKFRLDEFPQVVNVLKGDMSLVGTRPEVARYVDCYDNEMLASLLLEPGITGVASIYFKDEAEILEKADDSEKCYIDEILPKKMRLNLDYIKDLSIGYDIKILFNTFFAVSKG